MTGKVYYSRIYGNFSIYAKVHTGLDDAEYSRQFKEDRSVIDKLTESAVLNTKGQKLSPAELPTKFFADPHRKIKELPEIMYAFSYIIIQQKCADVLSKFNLGATELVPAKFYQEDRTTEVHGSLYVLNFGNVKESFVPEASSGMSSVFSTTGETFFLRDGEKFWLEPLVEEENQMAVSTKALEGPDLWHELRLKGGFFMSGPLRDALKDAELDGAFKLFACRVLGA